MVVYQHEARVMHLMDLFNPLASCHDEEEVTERCPITKETDQKVRGSKADGIGLIQFWDLDPFGRFWTHHHPLRIDGTFQIQFRVSFPSVSPLLHWLP